MPLIVVNVAVVAAVAVAVTVPSKYKAIPNDANEGLRMRLNTLKKWRRSR